MVRWLAAVFAGVLAVQASQLRHIPCGYILEYQDDSDPNAVLDEIQRKHGVEVRQKLHFKLFKGADVVFPDFQTAASAAADIGTMDGVKGIWQARLFDKPSIEMGTTGNGDVGHGDMKRKRHVDHDDFSPHVMTQVNLLREAGYVGKGFKVAIIDTGIDYTHPALGGGFGPGHLVSFGKDLVGDDYNGTNTPVPDPDPIDICDGHGTHVAGIIAAQPDKNPYGIIGAATGVNLGAYRVFGCADDPGVGEGVMIAAYNQAFEDGADLIHASIGSPGGWPESPWSTVVSKIVAHGVPCTLAAGNSGQNGTFSASSAADAIGAAAVGSVDNVFAASLLVNATYSVNGGAPVSFGFTPGLPNSNWTAQTLPLWTLVTNTSDILNQDVGCDPFPDTTPNLGGYIVLLPRGGCDAEVKAANALQWGARHMLLTNYVPGTRNAFNATVAGLAIGTVLTDQGVEWTKLLLSGAKVEVQMVDVHKAPVHLVNFNNTRSGGSMSTFSSWGPTWELATKPQFSAPGRDILSTFPQIYGSYLIDSGTSMSAPLVAGVYVLLMEATGFRNPALIDRLLSATAKPLDYNDGLKTRHGVKAPVPQQGAGLIQAFDASRTNTMFDVDSLAFNDTDHFEAVKNFTIINLGNNTLKYRLDHVAAATVYTFDDDKSFTPANRPKYPQPNILPNELVSGNATLEFFVPPRNGSSESPESFSVEGGRKRVVSVRVTKPTGLVDARMPVWSGWIGLTANDGSRVSLPYQGVTGSLRDRQVLDVNNTGVAGFNDGQLLLGPRTFLLPPRGKSNLTRWSLVQDTDRPVVSAQLFLGSPLVRADLIPVNVPGAKFNLTTILGTKTVGSLPGWPLPYQYPGTVGTETYDGSWDGRLTDGSYAPDGVYKISIKALRIFGNRDKREDYDEVVTLDFGIRYAYDF